MTVRRFHFTGRKKILREYIDISVDDNEALQPVVTADINLEQLNHDSSLPGDATVSLEAHFRTQSMRFSLGTVDDIRLIDEEPLSEFDNYHGVHFRCLVTSVDPDSAGLLIATADNLRPQVPDDTGSANSLLSVKPDNDLKHEIYRLDLQDRPVLLVNPNTGLPWKKMVQDPWFESLVLPSVFREILVQVMIVNETLKADNAYGWEEQWLRFAQAIPGVSDSPEDAQDKEQLRAWIDDACTEFTKHKKLLQSFSDNLDPDGS